MAYQHKIDWSDPRKGSDLVSFTMEPVKRPVLDFHVQIEGELEEIINLAFRDPTAVNEPLMTDIDLVLEE